MAAGLGFKTFTTGEVLTAGDVNGYLMQGVLVFASTAARDAAITSPQEGQFAYTKDTNGLWYYDGAAWVASGATGDIEGVTAGTGISGGGTSGTVTITNSMATAIDAKGDLVVGTGADTFSKLTVGSNATVLTADSAEATGMKWAAPTASGKSYSLLSTTTVSSGTSYTVTGLSGYDNLYVIFKNIRVTDTGNNATKLQINSVSSGCTFFGSTVTPSTTFTTIVQVTAATAPFKIMGNGTAGGQDLNGYFYIQGANTAGVKMITQGTFVAPNGGSLADGRIGTGTSTDSAVVSSLTLSTTGTAFTGSGQMLIYGAV